MKEVSKKMLVKTRKIHECYGCLKNIEKGEVAVCVTGKEDDQRFSFHIHVACNKIAHKERMFEKGFEKGELNQLSEGNDYSIAKTEVPF